MKSKFKILISLSFIIILLILSYILFVKPYRPNKNQDITLNEYSVPIRPGVPGESPFWNTYSRRFMYAPAFDFSLVEKATKYRFTAVSLANGKEFTFESEVPWAPLSPIWESLPVGLVALTAEGYDDRGQIFGLSGTRVFYRAAEYNGPYVKQKSEYLYSARRALEFLYRLKPYQGWLNASLDTSYSLYCYPSKIIGAVTESMLIYSKIAPDSIREKALTIARNAADFLISISEPEGTPFEFFPPTYYKDYETLNNGLFTRAKEYQGQLMMSYPAYVADIYLDLFDETGDNNYYNAAVRIADTYIKTQLPSGTWRLKVWLETGEAVAENVCIPVKHISLFDRLEKQYQILKYKSALDRAFSWILENPAKTFNWEGQFEDIPPVKEYANLAPAGGALEFASYIFDHFNQNPEYLQLAEDILRFVEDQFVVWEKPMPRNAYLTESWITPCVLEQYRYYTPVDATATKVMSTYSKAFTATGKQNYLIKATELANNLTNIQDSVTGQYPTWWDSNPKHKITGWFNCATADIKAIIDFYRLNN